MLKCSSSVLLLLASAASLVGPQVPFGPLNDRPTEAQPEKAARIDYGPAIPPGCIRFAIPIKQFGLGGGYILPYDEVHVLHMVRVGKDEASEQILLRKILFLGWLREFADPELVDVAVTPCQASQLVWATSVGGIRLILGKYGQEEP